MTQKRTVLGRGLSALIPDAQEDHAPNNKDGDLVMVPLDHIQAASTQPRTHFDSTRLDDLAQSIARDGVLQPILLRLVDTEQYTIIAGERRYRAAHRAKLHEVPAIIKETTATQAFEWAIVENIQREDLNPIEEAIAYQTLKDTASLSQEQLAHRLGKSRVAIANTLRLLKLPTTIRAFIESGELSAGHARAILMAPKQVRLPLARTIVEEGWTVRKSEAEAKKLAEGANATTEEKLPPKTSSRNQAVEAQLRAAIGAPIKVLHKKGKGKIEVRFHSFDELERLIELFSTLSEEG